MRHLLMLTPVLDEGDPVQGFAIGWVNALAAHVPRVTVAALRTGATGSLAANVSAVDLGRPAAPRARVAWRLARLAASTQADRCLTHMNWPMLLAAGPVLRARGIGTALWWAHGATPVGLRAAAPFARKILTSSDRACRIAPAKRLVLGQGIDIAAFLTSPIEAPPPFTVLAAGRIAPVKRLDRVVEACVLASVRLRIVGPGALPGIAAEPPVAHAAMPALLRSTHVFASASQTGSPDKVLFEAMACGLPVVALGESLAGTLPEPLAAQVMVRDVPAMATRLAALAAMPASERRAFGLALRDAVVERHALPHLADRIVAALDAC